MLVYFVRHGQSLGNVKKIFQDPKTPLTELGINQAEFIANRFSNIHIDKIISSTHKRASQTAEIIAKKIDGKVELTELAAEWKIPSELIGKSFKNKGALKSVKEMRSHDDPNWHFSDEENMFDLKDRAKELLEYLSNQNLNSVLVTSHSFFLKVIIAVMIFGKDITSDEIRHWSNSLKSNNTGITLCEYDKDKYGWRLVTYNDHSHLG